MKCFQYVLLAVSVLTRMGSAAITSQECLDQGGSVIGDPGDGSTTSDDYLCDSNGEPPVDAIVAVVSEGEPIATEDGVCCGPLNETLTNRCPPTVLDNVPTTTSGAKRHFWF